MAKESKIPYQDHFQLYRKLTDNGRNISLLLESRSLNMRYGKESIIVPNPAVRISGKNERFTITALTKAGEKILARLTDDDFQYAVEVTRKGNTINGKVPRESNKNIRENERTRLRNVSFIFRSLIKKFHSDSPYNGLYGLAAYDFARNYYSIGKKHKNDEGDDFIFFIPSELYVFNDITKEAKHIVFFEGDAKASKGFVFRKGKGRIRQDISDDDYRSQVSKAIKDIRKGRAMQCVLSRQVEVPLKKDPMVSYNELREINPSPYSFFFNLGNNEIFYGASPELHIKVEKGEIEIRPIAGTVKRSSNPFDDAQARIFLLTDDKERREHSMLVDLARNEIYALSYPESVVVSDLFTVEAYPNLYHLVSGVKGKLRNGIDAFDALLITLPAGTLSGAPKQEAMRMIEEYETSRRGFYGGIIGYFSFNGDCNTGIAIRSVHVKGSKSYIRSGGGVVALSTPDGELKESRLKMEKMLKVV